MTKPKVIVIWGSENILSAAIEGLLSTIKDWHVISITTIEDLAALILAEETGLKDIVIINQLQNYRPDSLPLQLLMEHPAIKVITISLENNMMEVYSKQNIFASRGTDLIAVIDNER